LIVKKVCCAALAALAIAGAPAHANMFGQFTPAEVLPVNEHLFGTYLTASDNVLALTGQLRLSFYPNVDFGFQGGLSRVNSDRTTVRLGGDIKFGVMHAGAATPIDLAIGGGLGIETGDDYTVLSVGPTAVASRTFGSAGSTTVIPYAGMALAFSSINSGPLDQTDFSVPFRFGAELRAIPGVRLVGELQLRLSDAINDDVAFAVGANFPF
jgi:hypothetical protein